MTHPRADQVAQAVIAAWEQAHGRRLSSFADGLAALQWMATPEGKAAIRQHVEGPARSTSVVL